MHTSGDTLQQFTRNEFPLTYLFPFLDRQPDSPRRTRVPIVSLLCYRSLGVQLFQAPHHRFRKVSTRPEEEIGRQGQLAGQDFVVLLAYLRNENEIFNKRNRN